MAASFECSVGSTDFICQNEFRTCHCWTYWSRFADRVLVLICFSDLTWRFIFLKVCTTANWENFNEFLSSVSLHLSLFRSCSCHCWTDPPSAPRCRWFNPCFTLDPGPLVFLVFFRRSYKIRSQYEGALDFTSKETCQMASKMRAGKLKWMRQALKRIGHSVAAGQGRFVSRLRSQSGSTISRHSPCSALCQSAWSSYYARLHGTSQAPYEDGKPGFNFTFFQVKWSRRSSCAPAHNS